MTCPRLPAGRAAVPPRLPPAARPPDRPAVCRNSL